MRPGKSGPGKSGDDCIMQSSMARHYISEAIMICRHQPHVNTREELSETIRFMLHWRSVEMCVCVYLCIFTVCILGSLSCNLWNLMWIFVYEISISFGFKTACVYVFVYIPFLIIFFCICRSIYYLILVLHYILM